MTDPLAALLHESWSIPDQAEWTDLPGWEQDIYRAQAAALRAAGVILALADVAALREALRLAGELADAVQALIDDMDESHHRLFARQIVRIHDRLSAFGAAEAVALIPKEPRP